MQAQVKDLEARIQQHDAQVALVRQEAQDAARSLADGLLRADRADAAAEDCKAQLSRATSELEVRARRLRAGRTRAHAASCLRDQLTDHCWCSQPSATLPHKSWTHMRIGT